ncbi:universal stress protein [Pseudolysinimonas sp.]|uniref:universal stress protein n=1 Tax=Pseudolysinimonas sp. TaxID=2680009 RepID=UPI003F81B98E
MERIAVGIGGAASRPAVDWVIERVRRRPAEIELVRAFDMLASDPSENRAELERTRRRVQEALPHAEVRTSLEMKTVPDALVDAAEHADLVVVGARRDHPVQSTLHGSVPLRIASRSRAVTVIVPADWTPGPTRDVVVGLDEGDTSDEALEFAAHEAVAAHARLTVVHTWAVPVQSRANLLSLITDEPDFRDAHRKELTEAVERLRDEVRHLDAHGVLEERPAADALAEHARDAGMVVIGSHRWGPLTGLVLGSTARALLARTAAPICVVAPSPAYGAAIEADALAADA